MSEISLRKAAQDVLSLVDYMWNHGEWYNAKERIDALREALAKPDEPVAVIGDTFSLLWASSDSMADIADRHGLKVGSKLYADKQPTQVACVPFTDEDLADILAKAGHEPNDFTDSIEIIDVTKANGQASVVLLTRVTQITRPSDKKITDIGVECGVISEGYHSEAHLEFVHSVLDLLLPAPVAQPMPEFDEIDDETIDAACVAGGIYRVDLMRAYNVLRAHNIGTKT